MYQNSQAIAYYITPHGFGHAVRALEIIRSLVALKPDLDVVVVSDIPESLIEQNVGRPLPYRRARLDVGLVQIDSLRFDLEATLRHLERLRRGSDEVIAGERRFLSDRNVRLVVSDIAFLPFRASASLNIPGIGISNFTWDWIYRAYAPSDTRWGPLVEWIREAYRDCTLFLQLPMFGDCSVCPRIERVPLVARKAGKTREQTRRILGIAQEQRAFLISFISLELSDAARARIEKIEDTLFFFKYPLHYDFRNARSLDPLPLSYPDVVAAMDGVVTKPGYGIASDCLANGIPIIYTDRGSFPEYHVLVEELEKHLNAVYISGEDFRTGRWGNALERVSSLPPRTPSIRTDGAAVCAERILESLLE